MSPAELVDHWRARAKELERFAPAAAQAFVEAAQELATSLTLAETETLTLEEAASESGYHADHLGALIRQGKIPNAGRPHAPRIRRGDLPRKPRRQRPGLVESGSGSPTLARITRDAMSSRTSRR